MDQNNENKMLRNNLKILSDSIQRLEERKIIFNYPKDDSNKIKLSK